MKIVGEYAFNDPDHTIRSRHSQESREIQLVISALKATDFRIPLSEEKTQEGRALYSTTAFNRAFRSAFSGLGWKNVRVKSDGSVQYYIAGYLPPAMMQGRVRDMDFIKNRLAVQVQFGRYFFLMDNIATKLAIFRNLGLIDAGVEIVPMQEFTVELSMGMSYYE